jgi:hypothetical protein
MTDLHQRGDVSARGNRSTRTVHRSVPPDTGSRPAAPLTRRERVLVGLELFLAVGAVAGGGGMLLDTSGRGQGLPNNLLDGTPFSSYLVPGIVLLGARLCSFDITCWERTLLRRRRPGGSGL